MGRKSKFTAEQIGFALKKVGAGVPMLEVCRKHGASQQTVYRQRSKYGEMQASEVHRLNDLEKEN